MGMRTGDGMQYGEERYGNGSAATWSGSDGVEKGQQPSGGDGGVDLISSREEHRWQRQGSATTGKRTRQREGKGKGYVDTAVTNPVKRWIRLGGGAREGDVYG